jgi:hypothetical protein
MQVRAHVTACAPSEVACDIEALRALVLPCGGAVEVERRAGSDHAAARRTLALRALLGAGAPRAVSGVLMVQCSAGVAVARIIGPAIGFEPSDAPTGEDGAHGVCYVGVLDARTTLTLCLDTRSATPAPCCRRAGGGYGGVGGGGVGGNAGGGGGGVVVQAALWYRSPGGPQTPRQTRVRVFTAQAGLWRGSSQPSSQPSSTDRAAELSAVLSALDVEASALLSARLAAVEACNLEKSERTGNALARAVVARAKALAARYGVPRLRVHEGWLWNSTTVLGYDVAEAPLPELLRRLHEVALGPAAVRTGRGRAQDGAQEHVTAVDVAVDIDAVHAARIGLLTLPAKEAARCAWRSAGEGASAGAQYGAHDVPQAGTQAEAIRGQSTLRTTRAPRHAAPLDLDGREAEDEEAVEHDADVARWCEALEIFGMREPAPD